MVVKLQRKIRPLLISFTGLYFSSVGEGGEELSGRLYDVMTRPRPRAEGVPELDSSESFFKIILLFIFVETNRPNVFFFVTDFEMVSIRNVLTTDQNR